MLIVTGSLAYDYIMNFPGKFSSHILPEQLDNINLSFIVDRFAKQRGGTAGNVSYTLGLLQTKHMLFSYAGKDFEEYAQAFNKIGIYTDHVMIDQQDYTSTGFALSDQKQNQIWGFYYGAGSKNAVLQLRKVAKKNDLVLIGPQGAEGSLSLIGQCIKLQIPYIFDPGFILTQVSDRALKHGIKYAHTVIGNEYEMQLMGKRIGAFAELLTDKIAITTRGRKGAIINERNNTYKIKSVTLKSVVSTTGAGDAWRGGYLAGCEKGFDLQTCGEMGAVAASYAVEHMGTQEHTYTPQAFAKRYKDTYNKALTLK